MAPSQENTIHFDQEFVLATENEHPDYSLTIDILSDLYAIRFRSYFCYLEDWNPYTDVQGVQLRTLAKRTAKHNELAMLDLSNLLSGMGATPKKIQFPQTDMHSTYTSWENILPHLVESQKEIVNATEIALSALAGAPAEECVRPTLEKHLTDDRQALKQLEQYLKEVKK